MNNFNRGALRLLMASSVTVVVACSGGGPSNATETPATAEESPALIVDQTVAPATAAKPILSLDTKTFRFSWVDAGDATHYKLLENSDGLSGYSQVGSDITQGIQTVDHSVALYARVNASYLLQSCNTGGCTDSDPIMISGTLVDAIGYLKSSDIGMGDRFGASVSISADGSTLAVGAYAEDSATAGINSTPNDDGTADDSGAVYVFIRSGNTWAQQAYIKADTIGLEFGKFLSFSADGNTLAVDHRSDNSATTGINSTPNIDGTADNSGAVYVFTRSGSTWSKQAYIKASNASAGDVFGTAVSISGDGNNLAVGAPFEDSATIGINSTPNDDGTADNSGAVYVFTRSGNTWGQQAYIKASNAGASDLFGIPASISGDGNTLVAGSVREDSATTGINSAPNDDGTANDSGAAYVFTRSGSTWVQQAYIKASNTGAGDSFGGSLSISNDGNTLAMNASYEDSATTGINSTPNDDGTANDSGAVYVFTRSASTWAQQAYIKASNAGAFDLFGISASISGDGNTLVAGSVREDSATSGINSTPNDDGTANSSGAAYVFTRSGSTWNEQAYIKASNNTTTGWFGVSVSISGDASTLVVGAFFEDGSAVDSGAVYFY